MSVDAWYTTPPPPPGISATGLIQQATLGNGNTNLGPQFTLAASTSYTIAAYLVVNGAGTLTLNMANSSFSGYFAYFAAMFPPSPSGTAVSAPTVSNLPAVLPLPGPNAAILVAAQVTVGASQVTQYLLTGSGSGLTVLGANIQVTRVVAPVSGVPV